MADMSAPASGNRQIWQRIKIMPSRLVDWEGKISF